MMIFSYLRDVFHPFFVENPNFAVNLAVDLINFLDFYLGKQPTTNRRVLDPCPQGCEKHNATTTRQHLSYL
ncbi:hypothetical protein SAMN03080598_04142 [Algoriphagus boritolerans DSM 17298 = JCM 18970]|uniref:Uncharacterized protein n=1 Tax=Algoriphagus boritolerans DSM 17298 = JCM 18970 TaxID=1120964 RepID=A0A1H6AI43_9BACT|nr:hypothetical protein SAMN03080598_04142 [Algoriphagus boritolerans DSM 17298 = JCM 18970]